MGRSFEVVLRGGGSFRPTSPTVFVPLVSGGDDCARLAARVRAGPLDRSLRFPYHPHVTVAHDLPDDTLDRAAKALAGFEASFTVRSFWLLIEEAAAWRPRDRFDLGHADGPKPAGFGPSWSDA
jgi:2'-5' RNA ligase